MVLSTTILGSSSEDVKTPFQILLILILYIYRVFDLDSQEFDAIFKYFRWYGDAWGGVEMST